jgi:hypothetical protein
MRQHLQRPMMFRNDHNSRSIFVETMNDSRATFGADFV